MFSSLYQIFSKFKKNRIFALEFISHLKEGNRKTQDLEVLRLLFYITHPAPSLNIELNFGNLVIMTTIAKTKKTMKIQKKIVTLQKIVKTRWLSLIGYLRHIVLRRGG